MAAEDERACNPDRPFVRKHCSPCRYLVSLWRKDVQPVDENASIARL